MLSVIVYLHSQYLNWLISTDYLASDSIQNKELPLLLKAAENEGTVILPIIVKPSRFTKNTQLARFQPLNSPENPLSMMSESGIDNLFLALTDKIERLINDQQV